MIDCNNCNNSKYAGYGEYVNSMEFCCAFSENLKSTETATKPCDKCNGKYYKEEEWVIMKFKELNNNEINEIKKSYSSEGNTQNYNSAFTCAGHMYDFIEDEDGNYYKTWVFVKIDLDKKEYSTILLNDLGNQWTEFLSANFNNDKVNKYVEKAYVNKVC